MNFTTFMSLVGKYVVNSDNAYLILYAVVTCLLVEPLKKLFVNKTKVDVFHKFDFAVILPFIVGVVFAVLDTYVVNGLRAFNLSIGLRIVVLGVSIGAFASTMFKAFKAICGQSLSSLMKNDIFGIFYTQLLYFGNVRQQLADKTITLQDFIEQVKLISANAKAIYETDDDADVKRCRLAKLLGGIIDYQSVESCINALNDALIAYTDSN